MAEAKPVWFSDAMKQIEVEITSWAEFQKYYDAHFSSQRARWCFRGHGNAEWRLISSLERLTAETKEVQLAERTLLNAFKRAAHHFCKDVPDPNNILEWLALMQHWGVPTRLIDFTLSPYVALFFGLRDAHLSLNRESKAALWAVNHVTLMGIAAHEINTAKLRGIPRITTETQLGEQKLFNNLFFSDHRVRFVAPVQPFTHNERLSLQRGMFLCASSLALAFDQAILQPQGFHTVVQKGATTIQEIPEAVRKNLKQIAHKLIFPVDAAQEIFSEILRMNINSGTLFPGLDGYARSIVDLYWSLQSLEKRERKIVGYSCINQFGWLS